MANPIAFTPKTVDAKQELQRKLAAAPNEHAEALLVAYDLLEEAHRQGILDALHGAIGAKDSIAGMLAKYAVEPASVNAARNVIALGRLMGALDPEPISNFSRQVREATESHPGRETKAPTLLQLFKGIRRPEVRRGLSLLTLALGALGRATE
jgi:uncharacterized protein YjgD (DUF1641 family)